jgi:hypothetical protein
LTCFEEPGSVLAEVHRVLRPDRRVVLFVPFMQPATGGELWRYTPEGRRILLRGFDVTRFERGPWVLTTLGYVFSEGPRRIGLGAFEPWLRTVCARLDGLVIRRESASASAHAIVARRRPG